MLGNPKYKREDRVSFNFEIEGEMQRIDGVIYVVDPFGTSEQKAEVSYDIEAFFRGGVTLFKHVLESDIYPR